jgi:basic membrane lipoprotein Med (substrate-binding protein (PBP1-ABC) superfamily)
MKIRRIEMYTQKKIWQLVGIVMVLAFLLAACGGAQPMEEETAAEEPQAEEVVVEEPAEAEVEEEVSSEPVPLNMCILLAVGLDQGWDRSFYESYNRVLESQPVEGVVLQDWKAVEGLWGDEAEAAMREYAESGECDIIWPHGGYNDNVDNIKADYPDIMFVEVGSGVLSSGGNDYHFWLRP